MDAGRKLELMKEDPKKAEMLIMSIEALAESYDETVRGGETVTHFVLKDRNVSVHSEGDCLGNVRRKAENIISYKIVRFF